MPITINWETGVEALRAMEEVIDNKDSYIHRRFYDDIQTFKLAFIDLKDAVETKCRHDKSYSNEVLLSAPPQRKWICRRCGVEGRDIDQTQTSDYEEVKKRYSK